ncbi:MAG: HIT family protein [Microgenomates group bacterium]
MEECIFCKIAAGEIPSYKVWEEDNFLAFLDIHPVAAGHTLVIPKKHFRWVWEVEDYGGYWEKVKEVALLLKRKLGADWIQVEVMGIDIPHAHVHLIPHFEDKNRQEDKENLQQICQQIKV